MRYEVFVPLLFVYGVFLGEWGGDVKSNKSSVELCEQVIVALPWDLFFHCPRNHVFSPDSCLS
jgi:hypothetical protein